MTVSRTTDKGAVGNYMLGAAVRPPTGSGHIMQSFDDIKADFDLLDDWEDRYRYLIELGRQLTALPETSRNDQTKVRGCVSQVWFASETDTSTPPHLFFIGDSDAHIVRGLVAVALALFSGRTAPQIIAIDAEKAFAELGLSDHLTPQRSNGLRSMVERIRSDARAALVS